MSEDLYKDLPKRHDGVVAVPMAKANETTPEMPDDPKEPNFLKFFAVGTAVFVGFLMSLVIIFAIMYPQPSKNTSKIRHSTRANSVAAPTNLEEAAADFCGDQYSFIFETSNETGIVECYGNLRSGNIYSFNVTDETEGDYKLVEATYLGSVYDNLAANYFRKKNLFHIRRDPVTPDGKIEIILFAYAKTEEEAADLAVDSMYEFMMDLKETENQEVHFYLFHGTSYGPPTQIGDYIALSYIVGLPEKLPNDSIGTKYKLIPGTSSETLIDTYITNPANTAASVRESVNQKNYNEIGLSGNYTRANYSKDKFRQELLSNSKHSIKTLRSYSTKSY